jgi:hypothetical protein
MTVTVLEYVLNLFLQLVFLDSDTTCRFQTIF